MNHEWTRMNTNEDRVSATDFWQHTGLTNLGLPEPPFNCGSPSF